MPLVRMIERIACQFAQLELRPRFLGFTCALIVPSTLPISARYRVGKFHH